MKINIVLLAFFLVSTSLFAQTNNLAESDTTKKKKRVNLSFRLDYGLNNQPAFIKTRYFYEGEFYNQLLEDRWEWVKQDGSAFEGYNDKVDRQTNIKFDLMLSVGNFIPSFQ